MNVPPPPLLVSFSTLGALLEALPQKTLDYCEQEIRQLVASGFPPLVSMVTTSTLFGVSSSFIGAMSRAPHKYYRIFTLRKGRKRRQIQAPRVGLKLIQRWFGFHLARAIQLPDCVFGFVPNKQGVIEAAKVHCSANWVYSLDLRDFFPSILNKQVINALSTIGYSERASELISSFCILYGSLPQGSPASPVLSNLVFLPTDIKLQEMAKHFNFKYTRYADDLVFSGHGNPPENLKQIVHELLSNDGWVIAEEKEHLAVLPARLKVHGLLVHGEHPRLTKGYRNRIRAYRHLLNAGKITPSSLDAVRGHLAYADLVERSAI